MTCNVQRLFGGDLVGQVQVHRISTARGLARVLAGYAHGDGWGVQVGMTLATLQQLDGWPGVAPGCGVLPVPGLPDPLWVYLIGPGGGCA
jgi:hypothetical protein